MKRRKFLQSSVASGAAILVGSTMANTPLSATATVPTNKPFELEEATIAELQASMQSGKETARSLVEKYLTRIEEIDKNGARINSVIETNPDALAIADALDQERKTRGARSPLHGIPILIKDNLDTADKMKTTAGSLAMLDAKPLRDAFVAQRLREAGAVILGKTNLSEWANFRSTHSTSGWSGRGGLTRNPYVLDRNPCGSSSGSGAAIAANLAAAAIGTETDGSIVCPSNANSLVGIKPTLGLVSRAGIIPIAHSQDTAGPMARTVADAAALLSAITGVDSRDKITQHSRRFGHPDYTKFLDASGLRGARIGIARNYFGFNDRVDKLLNDSIDVMKQQGAILVDPTNLRTEGKFSDSEFEVLLYEFKADLNAYLAGLGPNAPVRSLKDIIEFNKQNQDREMPYFGQEIMIRAQAKGGLTDQPYRLALRKNLRLTRTLGIDAVMAKHRLDAMIAPTGGPPWPTDLINGDHFGGGFSSMSAVAGYPHITVPAGYIFGLPVGLSIFGKAWSEPTLIKIAFAYEQATKLRRTPKYLPTADLQA